MTLSKARDVLGIPSNVALKKRATYELMLKKWKEEVVAARRKADTEREVELNEVKAFVKRSKTLLDARVCPTCASFKTEEAFECRACAWKRRYRAKIAERSVNNEVKDHV